MLLNHTQIRQQLATKYGLTKCVCSSLNTLANYAVEISSSSGHFALKIYNPASRNESEIQWEIDLTNHLIQHGVPAAKPIPGEDGLYLQNFVLDDQNLNVVMFEWIPGAKPKPELSTYRLIGELAAQIHTAADTFTSNLPRESYGLHELINDQLALIKKPLEETGQWQNLNELAERMRRIIDNSDLDYGIIHNDLTLDNVHIHGASIGVFDFDSAAKSWRAVEAWGVLKASEDRFTAWLDGYRQVREFSEADQKAVAVFTILEDIRNTVWKLGYAKSSRGTPLLKQEALPEIVSEWLEWERSKDNS